MKLIVLALILTLLCAVSCNRPRPNKVHSCETNSYRLITRKWNITARETVNPPLSTADVVLDFEEYFGPIVTALPGFVSYLGTRIDADYNWFQNVFKGVTNSNNAQTAALNFYQTTTLDLSKAITPVESLFLVGDIVFYFTPDCQCYDKILTGSYLSIRYWELQSGATFTNKEVSDYFRVHFAPTLTKQPGFEVYASMIPDNLPTHNLLFNVFKNETQANNSNDLALAFVAGSELSKQITLVEKDTIFIVFDLLAQNFEKCFANTC